MALLNDHEFADAALLELCGGVQSLLDATWLAVGADNGSPEAPVIVAAASTLPRRRAHVRASALATESAARCSAGLSAARARRGEHGGALEWDVTIETQATGVRMGVCRGDESGAEFSTNANLVLLGCGSGQRFIAGDWVTAGAVAARDAIPTGGSATFCLDFSRACASRGPRDAGVEEEGDGGDFAGGELWISVQGRARRLLAGGLGTTIMASASSSAALSPLPAPADDVLIHPACFLRTGDRAFSASAPRARTGFPPSRVALLQRLLEGEDGHAGLAVRARDCLGRSALATACDAAAPLVVLEALVRVHPAAAAAASVDKRLPLHRLCAALALAGRARIRDSDGDGDGNGDVDCETSGVSDSDVDDVEARFASVLSANPAAAGAADEDGRTPLHCAAASGAGPALVACCLRADGGEATSRADARGRTPLHLAVEFGCAPRALAALLAAHPAAAAAADADGLTPLHAACQSARGPRVLELLLRAQPDCVGRKTAGGLLPLHCAVDGGAPPASVALLIARLPAALKDRDIRGRSPLSAACEHAGAEHERGRGGRGTGLAVLRLVLEGWAGAARERNAQGMLPLHVAAAHGAPLPAVRLLLEAHVAAALDSGGESRRTPLEIAAESGAPGDVVAELLMLAVEHLLSPAAAEAAAGPAGPGSSGRASPGGGAGPAAATAAEVGQRGWTTLLRDGRDRYAAAVGAVLDANASSICVLAALTDAEGRRAVDIATHDTKQELLHRLYLCGRFEVNDGPPLHQSATSRVHYATDHTVPLPSAAAAAAAPPPASPAASPRAGGAAIEADVAPSSRQVVLKFMRVREQFERELASRRSYGTESANFVVPVIAAFDGEADAEVALQLSRRGFASHPFLLVMAAGDRCLSAIIDHEREVPDWPLETVRCARQLATALDFVHSRGSIHGDLKPRNVVRVGARYCLIDFDAATGFSEAAGVKRSTAFSPPELLCALRDGAAAPLAAPSFDAWGLGVTLFHMLTGQTLLHADASDNAADAAQLLVTQEWRAEVKAEKLSRVADRGARNLLSLLLQHDPRARPPMSRVLSHPYITGRAARRLPGEPALFDVFVSYRVASDRLVAEALHRVLSAAGLRVWLDSKCLQPGQSWEEGFAQGLALSSVFLPVLSRGAVNHASIPRQSFAALTPASPCDNVLLEHMLAAEMQARGLIRAVYPLFVGDLDSESRTYSNYFASGCHPAAAGAVVVTAAAAKLAEHLDRLGLGTPILDAASLSVASLLERATKSQGAFLEGDAERALALEGVLRDAKKIFAGDEAAPGDGEGGGDDGGGAAAKGT